MSQTATITVQSVNPPAPGKQKSKITDVAGDFYYAYPDKAAHFVPGETYEVSFTQTMFNGFKIRNIESGRRSTAAPQQTRATGPASAGTNTYRQTSEADKASMFVTALMKAAVQAQMIDIHNVAEIAQIGRNFREAHAQIWAAQRTTAQSQQAPQGQRTYDQHDEGDSIPF